MFATLLEPRQLYFLTSMLSIDAYSLVIFLDASMLRCDQEAVLVQA